MKKLTGLAVAVSLVLVMVAAPADAASPASATLSKSKKSISFKGGPFNMSWPFAFVIPSCAPGQPATSSCDHLSLKIDLGEGAKIEVQIKSTDPCSEDCLAAPVEGNDVDLYVYSPDRTEVTKSASGAGAEKVSFTHKAKHRNKAYDIAIRPWAVRPGTTYTGTIKALSLGK